VLAVVVATPCTAPFMGAAIGYALAQSGGGHLCVFTALALGLAAPYVALTLQPAWTRVLPKPGAWMEVLRQAVSVPIFATVIWLAWVLAGAYGAGCWRALLSSFCCWRLRDGSWAAGRRSAGRVVAGLILLGVVAAGVFAPKAGWRKCGKDGPNRKNESGYRCGRRLGAVVGRGGEPLPGAGPAGLCGLHRELVPELPGERARGARPAGVQQAFKPPTSPCCAPTGPATMRPSRRL
jgi:hypothetical protein